MLIVFEPFIFPCFWDLLCYWLQTESFFLEPFGTEVLCVQTLSKNISLFLTCVRVNTSKILPYFWCGLCFLSTNCTWHLFIWMHMWVLSNSLLFSHLIWIINGNCFLCYNALVWFVFCTASARFKIMCVLHNQQLWSSSYLKRCAKMYW